MGRTSDAKDRLKQAILQLMWEQSYGSLTIDAICDKAGVKKGSFYYFYPGKAELAVDGLAECFQCGKAKLDDDFSSSKAPMQRIIDFSDRVYEGSKEAFATHGRVFGCPYFNIGTEICNIEPLVAEQVQRALKGYLCYFSSTARDALAEHPDDTRDAETIGRCLFHLFEGTLTRARIENNPELIQDFRVGAESLLGYQPTANSLVQA
ncbi:MAG: TetR/AcrR family transcriptional repressor of nem operon [Candidatus Omnitrophota bacterium]|jgi:TetR/AcrR family transcriptional regulator, transcriptional repressor for nem operon